MICSEETQFNFPWNAAQACVHARNEQTLSRMLFEKLTKLGTQITFFLHHYLFCSEAAFLFTWRGELKICAILTQAAFASRARAHAKTTTHPRELKTASASMEATVVQGRELHCSSSSSFLEKCMVANLGPPLPFACNCQLPHVLVSIDLGAVVCF